MDNPKVVIGVGYGDEGKGATTNYLASPDSTIIRFNGGSQAGHTVVHNGFRHVFSSIGSGTLKGASTHLSKYFVLEPFGFLREYQHLLKNGYTPKVSIDPNAYITTPYDIYINRKMEEKRGKNKHGSVGIGFGETIERSESGYPFCVKDIFYKYDKLSDIIDGWWRQRCEDIGIDFPNIDISSIYDKFYELQNIVSIVKDEEIVKKDNLIFEGAQGLLLDPEYGTMPYCTRSNCGLKNVVELLGNRDFEVYYVTRPYTTRHGAGPLPFECVKPYDGIIDETNQPHEYQGVLRYAQLNIDNILGAMEKDISKHKPELDKYHLVISCFDQIEKEKEIKFVYNNRLQRTDKWDFINTLSPLKPILLSNQHL